MSAVSLKDLDKLIKKLSVYYDEQQVHQAIKFLQQWYQQEAFDNEDITNDWIPNDFINCHGIEIFGDKLSCLNNKQLSTKINNPKNKQILFQWFCYWLLDTGSKPQQPPFNTHIGKIAIQLEPKLRLHLKIADSKQIVTYFEKICSEEDYTEVQHLRGDFENIEDSYILHEIIKKFHHYQSYKPDIFRLIDSIINDRYMYDPFDLRSVDFKYRDSKESFNAAKELCMTEMKTIFTGAAKEYDAKTEQTNEDTIDTELIHAKALDFENRFPFLMCMIDYFSRYCCQQNRNHWKDSGYNLKPASINGAHGSADETAANWLMNTDYGKFFRSKHAETAQRFGCAMQSMMGRLLPRIGLNHILGDTIFDSLDIFCRYAVAMNKFVHKLYCDSKTMGKQQFFPCQIDFCIIPRLTKKEQHHDKQVSDDLWSVSMSQFGLKSNVSGLKQPQSSGFNKNMNVNYFGKNNNEDNTRIWNLEQNLKQSGYVQNKDYFVLSENNVYDAFSFQKIEKTFWKLWSQNVSWNMQRYKRYIVIVDRRNPVHIQSKTMVDDTNKHQTWNDTFYLIKPKKCNEISKHFEYKLSECFAANFKDYLFPISHGKEFSGLDSGNGYKFALSYHIQFRRKIKVYWSYGGGIQRFFIDDIEWLWPRYFNLVNKKTQFQTLSQDSKNELRLAKTKYLLCDDQFDDFSKQIERF